MRASKLFLALGLLALGATAAIAQSLPAGVQVSGGILTDSKGMTLYTWDKDEMGVASNCYDKCAENWPPLLVPADTAVDGDWSLMDRKDSDMKIVAYKGWPLYLWIKDTKPGDTTGDGVGGTWHTAVEGGAM